MRLRSRQISPGFTTIELMIAIGIIVILAGLLFMGGQSMLSSGKARATRMTLGSLHSMLSELDAKTRLNKSPTKWTWLNTAGVPDPRAADSTNKIDFWRVPYRLGTNPTDPPDAMDAPGYMGDTSPGSPSFALRNASRHVLNTQIVMNMLLGIPANRAALEKTSADRYFIPEWQPQTLAMLSPGMDRWLYFGTDGTEPAYYLSGAKVQHEGAKYVAVVDNPTAPPVVGGTSPWFGDTSPPVPIFLDAWNNPIIFVPGTGLRLRMLNGEAEYKTDNSVEAAKQTFIIVSPEGKVQGNGTNAATVTQPGRPFFASAGPDGDFAKGDDNIYSFEQ